MLGLTAIGGIDGQPNGSRAGDHLYFRGHHLGINGLIGSVDTDITVGSGSLWRRREPC